MSILTPEGLNSIGLPPDATDQQIHERILLIKRHELSHKLPLPKKLTLKEHLKNLAQNHPDPEVKRGANLLLRDIEEQETRI